MHFLNLITCIMDRAPLILRSPNLDASAVSYDSAHVSQFQVSHDELSSLLDRLDLDFSNHPAAEIALDDGHATQDPVAINDGTDVLVEFQVLKSRCAVQLSKFLNQQSNNTHRPIRQWCQPILDPSLMPQIIARIIRYGINALRRVFQPAASIILNHRPQSYLISLRHASQLAEIQARLDRIQEFLFIQRLKGPL